MNTDEFIERAKKIHGDKYDYSKVVYKNNKSKVCIICQFHGEFWQVAGSHLRGCGCRKCADKERKEKYTLTTEEFIKRAKKIHGDKYDYSKVDYINCDTKICIICPSHGEFWQLPSTHLKGSGCKKCGDLSESIKKRTTTTESLITKFQKVHGDKYDYSEVEFVNWKTKVKIYCKKHNFWFYMLPANHLYGQGCEFCKREKISNQITKKTFSQFLEDARKVHGNKYDYSLSENDYKNVTGKIKIICHKIGNGGEEHGIFYQRVCDHINGGCGCPKCCESKMEKDIAGLLIENGIKYDYQKTFTWLKYKAQLKLDFYLPEKKIAIECQGGQHFSPVERFGGKKNFDSVKIRDNIKKTLCEAHGIKMLYFSTEKHEGVITNKDELLLKLK